MATPSEMFRNSAGIVLRVLAPCLVLVAGWYGFKQLSIEVEQPPEPTAEKAKLRTRVEEIHVGDYPVIISTHAVVQAHNPVTLSPEVAGKVNVVSPSFEVGSYFREGELLVELDRRDYETALAIADSELDSARSALKLAKLNEERKLRLIKANAVSGAEVYEASAVREQAEADVELAGTRLEQARLNLSRTKVTAPFDGRVQSKLIGIGQTADANTPLGEVFAIDFAELRLPISGDQRQFLELPERAGDPPVAVTLEDAIDESNKGIWRASIVRTEGVLDEDSRDLFAIARVDDPFGLESGKPPLRIGQPVRARIEGQVLRDVVALPRAAVRQLDRVVLVGKEDLALLPIEIAPIWSDAESVVVPSSSIPSDKWLATTPMPFTPEGSVVEIIPETDVTTTTVEATPADAAQSIPN